MVKLAAGENVMELISLKLDKYHVKKVDVLMDIIVQIMELVEHVARFLLIVQNVHMKFQKIKLIMNSNVLNVKVMNIL